VGLVFGLRLRGPGGRDSRFGPRRRLRLRRAPVIRPPGAHCQRGAPRTLVAGRGPGRHFGGVPGPSGV